MRYSTVLVTAPTVFPVTLAEAKLFLKIDTDQTTDDDLITSLLTATVEHVESYLNRRLITQTWDLKLDYFPCGPIVLPYGKLQSITSISYVDTSGATQTWSSGDYQVDTADVLGKVLPNYGESYPSTQDVMNAVTVRFVCGYGSAGSSVPDAFKTAILMLVRQMYDKRGESVTLDVIERLLWPQRIDGLGMV